MTTDTQSPHRQKQIELELKPLRAACRIREAGYGSIITHPAYPILYDANLVILKRLVPELSVAMLEAQLRPIYKPLGVTHLRFMVPDPAVSEALELDFLTNAYKQAHYQVMQHTSESQRTSNPELSIHPVTGPVGFMRLDQVEQEVMREVAWNTRILRSALSTRRREVASHIPIRWFWAEYRGTPVGSIALLVDGPYASIQEVSTRPSMRRRGVATTMVLAMLEQAQASGAQHVTLLAEAEDWPKDLYAHLGFEVTSTLVAYLKEFET